MSENNLPALIESEDPGDINYLKFTTQELLEAFGKGNHIPGSGSAAALTSLIAIEMMRTVLRLSLTKDSCREYWPEFEFIFSKVSDEHKPRITELFQLDSKEFHKVSFYRRKRDNTEGTEREKYSKAAIDQLRIATDISLEICELSFKCLEFSIGLFDKCYAAVKGDAGVAISNLLSAVSGTLYVSFLNLKSFKKSDWKQERMNRAVNLAKEYTKIQKQAYSKVVEMYNASTDDETPQLTIEF